MQALRTAIESENKAGYEILQCNLPGTSVPGVERTDGGEEGRRTIRMKNTVIQGDCLDVLKTLPDGSVDAVVTDPPYLLNFMNKSWDSEDSIAASPELWREVLRVLKPGGHALIFSGDRTHHRVYCAIEDAGFEIRTSLYWLFGSGFPKSLDISKEIDRAGRREFVLTAVELGMSIPGNSLHDWTKGEHSPSDGWWEKFKGYLGEEDWRKVERVVIAKGFRIRRESTVQIVGMSDGEFDITAPATDAAKKWQGWGTALKPAAEIICLARRPLSEKTVAKNVLKHGTGGLNIDGCRIGEGGGCKTLPNTKPGTKDGNALGRTLNTKNWAPPVPTLGRWPSNVILDEEAAGLLDEMVGPLTSGAKSKTSGNNSTTYFVGIGGERKRDYDSDFGSASRFFYVAKASGEDRPEYNKHPTVKPTDLMRQLVRLVTPPGGVVLDPFAGSGSTLVAAKMEHFNFLGIERETEYVAIARRRISEVPESLFDL